MAHAVYIMCAIFGLLCVHYGKQFCYFDAISMQKSLVCQYRGHIGVPAELSLMFRLEDHFITTPLICLITPLLGDICGGELLLPLAPLKIMPGFHFHTAMTMYFQFPFCLRSAYLQRMAFCIVPCLTEKNLLIQRGRTTIPMFRSDWLSWLSGL